ncbi:uncharacterized protein LOC135111552 isoform X4 [Scylla paramamosain]|uniref:uncharacterized protein LOC135111552 isoform X4 n=1 Tax=Scylla paramamosain TaxID=85552 RepID=UPI0030836979
MGFVRLAPPRVRVNGWSCFDAHHAALSAATFTLCSSAVMVLVYIWRLVLNAQDPEQLQDVYYGVQISYMSTLGTHLTLIALTSFLFIGIRQRFDAMCSAEVSFYLFRATINMIGLWAVMRFVKNIRAGITYKDPEAIEL